MSEHTPTPWRADMGEFPPQMKLEPYLRSYVGPDGETIRVKGFALSGGNVEMDEARANSEFIVKAVNCHDDLVAALRAVEPFGDLRPSKELKKGLSPADRKAFDEIIGKVRAALAKVNAP
jgi:hypothetical protein